MTTTEQSAARIHVTASPDGRVTIPAPVRRAAGIEAGQQLVAYVEDGRVVLEEWGHLLRRVQQRVATATADHPGLASDELLADRRAETARENASPNATIDGTSA